MIACRITHNPGKLPPDEAEAHNRKQVEKAARLCPTLDDVTEISVTLAGHLSSREYIKFRDKVIDAWFALNVRKLCEEVEYAILHAD